jgi:hypothetical protein
LNTWLGYSLRSVTAAGQKMLHVSVDPLDKS